VKFVNDYKHTVAQYIIIGGEPSSIRSASCPTRLSRIDRVIVGILLNNAGQILLFLFASAVFASSQSPDQNKNKQIANFFPHHRIRTKNQQSQNLFDEGLGLIYALDYSGAAKAFRAAAKADPTSAMAYWGISYALGSDYYYHTAGDPAREREAYDALQRAQALAADGAKEEKQYILATSKRYCNCQHPDRPKQAMDFKNAMADLVRDYPDDLDAATLYAQSIMNLRPWELWNPDGTPAEGTPEILAVLESVLRRDPHHWGAIHYYIHAVEASPHPERALAQVQLLPTLTPAIGHLVHMPAHIYIRTGDYPAAEAACRKAALLDENHLQSASDMFTVLSYLHDLYFLAAAAGMDNDYATARKAALKVAETVAPHLNDKPALQVFLTVQPSVLIRFHRWGEILRLPEPDRQFDLANTFWHFTHGIALAATSELAASEAEQRILQQRLDATGPNEIYGMSAVNKTRDVLTIASDILAAKILMAKHDYGRAIVRLRDAVKIQDSLKYSEPPTWFYPVRESLGAALLVDGQSEEAERTFREDLLRNPRNPRSLFGLLQALQSGGKSYDALYVEAELKASRHGEPGNFNIQDF
jgi:tetratricopeptide (TPR) repeat protein